MSKIIYLDERRPTREEPKPVRQFLRELASNADELANDWLFEMVDAPTKRRMLAERGLAVRDSVPA